MNNRMYKLMNWPEIEAVVYAESDCPKTVLGPHSAGSSTLYQTFIPNAKEVRLRIPDEDKSIKMEQVDESGFFALLKTGKVPAEYTYIAEYNDGRIEKYDDAYRYNYSIDKKLIKNFSLGKTDDAYEFLGAFPTVIDKKSGVVFSIWAPNARRVSVMGDFNKWNNLIHQLSRVEDSGVFTIFIPGAKVGDKYYYEINTRSGLVKTVIDPYSLSLVNEDGWYKSVVMENEEFSWTDAKYLKERKNEKDSEAIPVSIYECDLAAYSQLTGKKDYVSLGIEVAKYAKEMGFTHVELKPVAEYEREDSKGYETVAYYAPTCRYGTPSEFAAMIDNFHKEGIKVILDWTLAHPSSANYALRRLDGTGCYEHEDPRQGIMPEWGTLLFNYGRGEVVSFLRSNALYWINRFHIDGLRIDSMAPILCLDYGRNSGDWIPNMFGGHENIDALEFIKNLNNTIKREHPGVITIAEDSSAWQKVTEPVDEGGLGFNYKWNIGWRDDYLRYIAKDPLFRGGSHNELTLSMLYAYSDRFILPLPLLGVNDPKLSIAYMMSHPGAKFIGNIADGLEDTKAINKLIKAINLFYAKHPALYELDTDPEGFEWINCMDAEKCTLSFIRRAKNGQFLVIVVNFSGIEQNLEVGVSMPGKYTRVFNTDASVYGGSSKGKEPPLYSIDEDVDGRPYYIPVTIPELSLSIFEYSKFDEGDWEYMQDLHQEAKKKADKAKADAAKEEAKALEAQKKAETEAKKAEEAAKIAELARIKAEEEFEKAQAELEKARIAADKAKEAAKKAELAAHRLKITEDSMKK